MSDINAREKNTCYDVTETFLKYKKSIKKNIEVINKFKRLAINDLKEQLTMKWNIVSILI